MRGVFVVLLVALARVHALRVCLVGGLPWQFGAYQRQLYLLSVGLSNMGHEVSLLDSNPGHTTEEKQFTAESYSVAVKLRAEALLDERDQSYDHLTFLGRGPSQTLNGSAEMPFSSLNEVAKAWDIEVFVTLMDSVKLYRDEVPEVPLILWMPYHYPDVESADLYLFRGVTAVASLAPTMASMIADQVGPGTLVSHVPHEVEIASSFEAIDFQQHRYTVLMQGGNYEQLDRKGWLTGVLAFTAFYEASADGEKPHLYLHAINFIKDAEKRKGGVKAPKGTALSGVPLLRYLEATGLPRSAWTLDEALHDPSHVTALKSAADVCLHASKTEGFGLNVLECQLVGTPVITTKFSAMEDYTFNGISVPNRQLEWMHRGLVATPDVQGVAEALAALRALSPEQAAENARAAQKTIRKRFSSTNVAKGMDDLIKAAVIAHSVGPVESVGKRYTHVTDETPPQVHWDTPWTLVSSKDVRINADRVDQVLASPALPKSHVYVVPYIGPDGGEGPIRIPGSRTPHPNLPVIVSTHMFSHAQHEATSRHAITAIILAEAKIIKRLPDGIAAVITRPTDRVEL